MSLKVLLFGEFFGHPVDRTLYFHYQKCGFSPWLGSQGPASCTVGLKKKKEFDSSRSSCRTVQSLIIVEEI